MRETIHSLLDFHIDPVIVSDFCARLYCEIMFSGRLLSLRGIYLLRAIGVFK